MTEITIEQRGNTVTIWRERRATRAERKTDAEATVMAEVISVTFGVGEPEVSISRDLCAP